MMTPIAIKNQAKKICETMQQKWSKQSKETKTKILVGLASGIFIFLLIQGVRGKLGFGLFEKKNEKTADMLAFEALVAKYENCTTSFSVPKQETIPKVFWTPGFPDSVDEALLRSIASGITGHQAPARSFYAASGAARQCASSTSLTSLCLVDDDVDPEHHRSYTQTFNGQVIVLLRNPKTWFPANNNDKAIRYHQQTGQVSEESWRSFRDSFFQGFMTDRWKPFFRKWDNMTYFKVAMYFPYEHLMDPSRGPILLKQLAFVMQAWGFHTILETRYPANETEDDNLACFWYQQIGRQRLEVYQKYHYDYSDFVPGFRTEDRTLMLEVLDSEISNTRNHPELTAILKEYYQDVLNNTRIDDTSKG
ncbi:hypothetical protein ACA910_019446 [Epithemia clementina (nom. ined.)]